MATYGTNDLKSGLKVMIDGSPCTIVECEFIKPGKGQAFTRVKIRNLKTRRMMERTYKSGETIESADVVEKEMDYLYNDNEFWHFMVPDTFEQYAVPGEMVAEVKQWLSQEDRCMVTLWNDEPIQVTPPNFVELKVIETDPGLKGDTSGGGGKPATLETGAIVRIPLFIQEGEVIRVDTRSGEYVSRVKK